MLESGKHRSNYVDNLEKKLFMLRDADGSRNLQVSPLIRRMQREMGSLECFVGVTPLGSSVTGYSTRERHGEHNAQSDIDFALLFDSSIDPKAEQKLKKIYEYDSQIYLDESDESHPTHMPGNFRHDLNMDGIRKALTDESSPQERRDFIQALASLAGLAVGPQVDRYRDEIGKVLNDLPSDHKQVIIEAVAAEEIHREQSKENEAGSTGTKMENRMFQGEAPERVAQMLQMRHDLWKERIIKVFGLLNE